MWASSTQDPPTRNSNPTRKKEPDISKPTWAEQEESLRGEDDWPGGEPIAVNEIAIFVKAEEKGIIILLLTSETLERALHEPRVVMQGVHCGEGVFRKRHL
jgi:hypothetical protein